MKIRHGFVSNSSSTSFLITNTSSEPRTLKDFVVENADLIDQFNREFSYKYTLDQLLAALRAYDYEWAPGQQRICVFGDEHHNAIGHVYDYILRDGGCSDSFKWSFHEHNR